MTPKIRVSALAVAAVCVFSSCATKPPLAGTAFPCPGNSCTVPVAQRVSFGDLDFPEYIDTSGTTVMVTWDLSSEYGTVFSQRGGIEFDDKQRFDCHRDHNSPKIYMCTGSNLQPKTSYKYSIRTNGVAAPPPVDPFIRNN